MQKFSYLKSINADYLDEVFARYLENPTSVDDSWRYFFEGLELGGEPAREAAPRELGNEAKVVALIQAYRSLGKRLARLDPLSAPPVKDPELEPDAFGLTSADLDRTFQAGNLVGLGAAKLSEIIARLKQIYCGTIAYEFTQIESREARDWVQARVEGAAARVAPDADTRRMILRRLTEAEDFERFLHTRYVAQKRFSLEGGESLIPSLDCMIETAAEQGASEFVFGMAHRGRLNVLTQILGKKPEYAFTEFEGNYKVDLEQGEGDVKYHKGLSHDFTTRNGKKVHLSLASNPSHLEFVNPVVEGIARAKQERPGGKRSGIVPVLIHGDAAFAGQGVCYETLNLSQLEGYSTGGTLHVVINNQIGFTATPSESRSTRYATDLAKMMDAPIFHVNGDDPDAVWFVSKLATEYRQKFAADVFVDLICYRKHGHNEGDEPTFTSPLLYKEIKAHASTRELYAAELARTGVIGANDAQKVSDEIMASFTEAQKIAKEKAPYLHPSVFQGAWKGFRQPESESDLFAVTPTSVDEKALKEIAHRINTVPDGFHLHPKLHRFFEARLKAVAEGKGIDWGNAEALAYASLVAEGRSVRLSGQDAGRGTFTHRHSILIDHENGKAYLPYNAAAKGKGRYSVYNSHLSEMAVLGFEYGYSLADPQSLVIWEAQFGDFANGAQVIIDQFISSGESKWDRMSGVTLLLPHSYEGQGPEHSSARLERFLSLCGRNNIFVCYPTTPAQIFHLLRRQVISDFRKPLVIMSPKSLLRHPMAISSLSELSAGHFQEVIPDPSVDTGKAKQVILCSGKVYYDLVAERAARKRFDVPVVRIEQFYPWPKAQIQSVLSRYSSAKDILWVQEEPRNMGGWSFVFNQWMGGYDSLVEQLSGRRIRYVGRDIGAAPAVGSPKVHEIEQRALLEKAFSEC